MLPALGAVEAAAAERATARRGSEVAAAYHHATFETQRGEQRDGGVDSDALEHERGETDVGVVAVRKAERCGRAAGRLGREAGADAMPRGGGRRRARREMGQGARRARAEVRGDGRG